MIGKYMTHAKEEYEVFTGIWTSGKKRETRLLCKRTKCEGVPDTAQSQPYPIDTAHIEKMLRLGLWTKTEK